MSALGTGMALAWLAAAVAAYALGQGEMMGLAILCSTIWGAATMARGRRP